MSRYLRTPLPARVSVSCLSAGPINPFQGVARMLPTPELGPQDDLSAIAKRYGGRIGAILQHVAKVRGVRYVRHAYVRDARAMLQKLGVREADAYAFAGLLKAEQMRRL